MKIRPTVLSMSFSLDLVPIRVISVIRGSKFGCGCAALGNPRFNFAFRKRWAITAHFVRRLV